MPAAPLPPDELARLSVLDDLHLLDTPSEPVFDRVTRLACRLLDVPMALFSLVDADRQWFKSRVGLDAEETPREYAFCAHAIGMSTPLVVNDALLDARFSDNPLVNGPPNIRFYAGVPIRTSAGLAIGTLCALDTRPRVLTEDEAQVLGDLAAILTKEVHYRERIGVARDHLQRSTEVLGASEARFRTIFEIASIGIALVAPDGGWISVNKALCDIVGYTEDELWGRTFQQITHPDDVGADVGLLQSMGRGEIDEYQLEKRYIRKDGAAVWINLNVSPKRDAAGAVEYYVTVVKDIDAQKRAQQEIAALNAGLERRVDERTAELQQAAERQRMAEQELRVREAELRSVIENANDAYISLDEAGAITAWNRQAEETFGWSRAEALGQMLEELIIPLEYRERHRDGMQRFLSTGVARAVDQRLELPALRRDGTGLTVEVRIRALDINGRTMFSAFLHDITDRKQEQAQREYESRHDVLTGLLNRRALQESVPLAQARASRNGKTVGMLFIDLDGFKAVNDSQGHEAGDILLGVIAERLRAGVRKTDSVYRLAGDEFTVLLEDMADTFDDAHTVAEKLIASISEPVELPGRAVRVRASIGIALDAASQGRPAEELLKEADQYMYRAKKAGRGRVCSAKYPC
ncbi:PAS domain S-box protein [Massilia yuzhufengensis]|uniref:PAS domain S-box-containing protein/diguanylate cyclase (GGDEF) domain-containing protein n=1 Tax=Massilia yuzhufengensis TaxID=1164594 RepID=A0A1I1E7H7_9BURK|nr:PAS domain S-box protein [Massilia yuzhufengensis]SFB82582.1 PAS domain S-box-containing protein/diguanylate cyclase (GGDEF) domain-containing protein [Massilia yuzhufengensis]